MEEPGRRLASLQPGDYELSLEHDQRKRTYIVHLPPRAMGGRPLPVVLNFHGGGGSAAGHKAYTRMDAVADREGFLAIYPNGTGRLRDRLLTWNAGTCCEYAAANRVNDVGFVLAVLEHLGRMVPIDRRRIYATGLSNGALLAYRLAVEAPDRIVAIAPVAGGMVVERFSPSRPVPVMHIHSVDDPRALYQGGTGPPFPMTDHRVDHPNIERMLAAWVAHDGCPGTPRVATEIRGTISSPEADHTASKYVYGPCREGAEVVLWKLSGAGHVWPGGTPNHLRRILGPSTGIIDASVEMWGFFSRFRLP